MSNSRIRLPDSYISALASGGRLGFLIAMTLAAPLAFGAPDQSARTPAAGSGSSLGDLEPFLLDGPGRESIVVLSTSGTPVFERNSSRPYTLASVAKVYIIVTFLDRVEKEQRQLTAEENQLMHDMIELSDNDAASALWERSGGRDALKRLLAEKRLPNVVVPRDGSWGEIKASARDVALLLLHLYEESLLSPAHTATVLYYMQHVIDSQAWGVGAGRDHAPPGTDVYVKNGWYPEDDGWIMNSVGILDSQTGSHIVVILTDRQPSLEDGKRYLTAALNLLRNHFGRPA